MKPKSIKFFLFGLLLLFALLPFRGFAQPQDTKRITSLESRVSNLENRGSSPITVDRTPVILILFGGFCALWAQNTGRNPWLWFFLGLLFSVFTVYVVLRKNADDREK